jgi:Skp family chaperone for outer membrane proteins
MMPLMLLALLVGGIGCLPASLSAELRCATVNMPFIVINYHKHIERAEILDAELNKHKQDRTALAEKRAEVDYAARELGQKILQMETPPPKGSDIRNEYNRLVGELNALGKDIRELGQNQIRIAEKNLYEAVTKSHHEIQAVISQYAREQGYQWVIDTGGVSNTGMSPLLYARNAQDITREILDILNKEGAPAAPTKAPDGDKAPDEHADQPGTTP